LRSSLISRDARAASCVVGEFAPECAEPAAGTAPCLPPAASKGGAGETHTLASIALAVGRPRPRVHVRVGGGGAARVADTRAGPRGAGGSRGGRRAARRPLGGAARVLHARPGRLRRSRGPCRRPRSPHE